MLPTFVRSLFWGDESQNTANQQALSEPELIHTVCEAQDDWVVIKGRETGEAVTENESVCSEASEQSWIVEPSPRFKQSNTPVSSHHSLEDLLIEHPTMSIYASHTSTKDQDDEYNETKSQTSITTDAEKDPKNMQIVLRNQNTQLVLAQNRVRQLMATQLGIPASAETIQKQQIDASSSKQRNGKQQAAKQSFIRVSRGKKSFKIHQCGVKAGKRRC